LAELSGPHQYILYTDEPQSVDFAPSGTRFEVRVLGLKLYLGADKLADGELAASM
jgi:hypothetical protein